MEEEADFEITIVKLSQRDLGTVSPSRVASSTPSISPKPDSETWSPYPADSPPGTPRSLRQKRTSSVSLDDGRISPEAAKRLKQAPSPYFHIDLAKNSILERRFFEDHLGQDGHIQGDSGQIVGRDETEELDESDDLEEQVGDGTWQGEDEEGESLPIYFLDEYSLYLSADNRFADVSRIDPLLKVRAAGLAVQQLVQGSDAEDSGDDFDGDEDPGEVQRVAIHDIAIKSWQIWNGEIWLESSMAWYRLRSPSSEFAQAVGFDGFHELAELFQRFSLALDDGLETMQEFEKTLAKPLEGHEGAPSPLQLDHDMIVYHSKDLLMDLREEISNFVDPSSEESDLIRGNHWMASGLLLDLESFAKVSRKKGGTSARSGIKSESQLSSLAPQIMLTATVSRIAAHLFVSDHKIKEVSKPLVMEEDSNEVARNHLQLPEIQSWDDDPEFVEDDGDGWPAIRFGSCGLVRAGDWVAISQGESHDTYRARRKKNTGDGLVEAAGNTGHADTEPRPWLMLVSRVYVTKGGKAMIHGHWAEHGVQLPLLKEVSAGREIFLLNDGNDCGDFDANTILSRVDVQYLPALVVEPSSGSNYFYRYMVERDEASFREAPAPLRGVCIACERDREEERRHQALRLSLEHYRLRDFDFKIGNFVYYRSEKGDDTILRIGRIESFDEDDDGEVGAKIRSCGRWDELVHQAWMSEKFPAEDSLHKDCRKVFIFTDKVESIPIYCLQEPVEAFLQEDPASNGAPMDSIIIVGEASHRGKRSLAPSDVHPLSIRIAIPPYKVPRTVPSDQPLRALDIFAGAGGLSLGLELSGIAKVTHAVEWSPKAAEVHTSNMPECKTYCSDANVLLKDAIERAEGRIPSAKLDNEGKLLDHLPIPSKVVLQEKNDGVERLDDRGGIVPAMNETEASAKPFDIICAGPPCQSFSGANMFKHIAEFPIKNVMVLTSLSFVEFYRPDYFILENVQGMFHYTLGSRLNAQRTKLVGGIENGVVKIIFRVLMALGYQVRLTNLLASAFGPPQNRLRIVFMASRRGLPMIETPVATHETKRNGGTLPLKDGTLIFAEPRPLTEKYLAVSFADAVSDLPRFDIGFQAVVHETRPTFVGHKVEPRKGIDWVGHGRPKEYRCEPMSSFQVLMREGGAKQVTAHKSCTFTADIVERILAVPLRSGARASDIPDVESKVHGGRLRPSSSFLPFMYGRIQLFLQGRTVLTKLRPDAKSGGHCLHPYDQRTVTLREVARLQSFPDWFELEGRLQDLFKCMGNAVPVLLGKAIGISIGRAFQQSRRSAVYAYEVVNASEGDGQREEKGGGDEEEEEEEGVQLWWATHHDGPSNGFTGKTSSLNPANRRKEEEQGKKANLPSGRKSGPYVLINPPLKSTHRRSSLKRAKGEEGKYSRRRSLVEIVIEESGSSNKIRTTPPPPPRRGEVRTSVS
ncbi:S-adenosyl-L-methionine-dependent methyltransferase [Violaceomyces palustris]|uniref:S-adenosyl-L-methionine-dependent methyltransferase n=1 Tax=Violaceomyces palustris TaxID=1673888 RepID=A0ACD0NQ57_9BASI|nr:S-adenosyl-L-methionine-dependent methyltransferase [Violaceomyces palustris]